MTHSYFVTGTDTGVGKTLVTSGLLARARQSGIRAVGLKPLAAGVEADGRNEDVVRIMEQNAVALPLEVVNPYCFTPPIAPHIAASEVGVEIQYQRVADTLAQARREAEMVFVEGAGGFCVPISRDRNYADLVRQLQLPVILVVGMRLGCLNHALLTAEAISTRGLVIAGWVANRIEPEMSRFEENLSTLKTLLLAPLLGVLPHQPGMSADTAAQCLALPTEFAADHGSHLLDPRDDLP